MLANKFAKTKILATIGPATDNEKKLNELKSLQFLGMTFGHTDE